MGKYTLTGSKEFDNLIDEQLKLVTEEILKLIPEQDIAAILLGRRLWSWGRWSLDRKQ